MANLDNEPASTLEDTQPRPPVFGVLIHADDEEEIEEPPRSGCRNPLLMVTVGLAFGLMCIASIALAGLAGWRDGTNLAGTKRAAAIVATVGIQAGLAQADCTAGRYELCLERCKFIATQQPGYPGMAVCINSAQIALSATPTPTTLPLGPTPTHSPTAPRSTTPGPSPTATTSGGFSREDLFVRGQEAFRTDDYENAMKWLEALRGLDPDYQRSQVEDMLMTTYDALGKTYENAGQLSEMIFVIQKGEAIRPFPTGSSWDFTVNVAQLYLDARNYLVAGNIKNADSVFARLMGMDPTFMDTRTLACKAFAEAGDSALSAKYKC